MEAMDEAVHRVKRAALAMQRYSWEQGVLAQAFLELGDLETAVLMAVEGMNRQIDDGRCAQIGDPGAVTDPCCIGEVLITACERTGDPQLIAAKEKLLTWALQLAPRNADGIVYHLAREPQIWVDSFYMLPPFLARAGAFDEALQQIDGYWQILFNAEKGLLSHIWDDGHREFIRADAWCVGNGWAAAGMARVIDLLPEKYADWKRVLAERVQTILYAALKLRCQNGMFHDVLDDSRTFEEINAGQMFAYTIFRGVTAGWLRDTVLLREAESIYQTALAQIDRYGLVQNVCGMPTFDHCGVAPEGQAFFLLMAAAREKYHTDMEM